MITLAVNTSYIFFHSKKRLDIMPATNVGHWFIALLDGQIWDGFSKPVLEKAILEGASVLGFDLENARLKSSMFCEPWKKNHYLFPSPEKSAVSVYFIQAEIGGPIKIGQAVDVRRRLADVQNYSPFPLVVLAVVPNSGETAERELHKRFSAVRDHGEWFAPTAEILEYIAIHGREFVG